LKEDWLSLLIHIIPIGGAFAILVSSLGVWMFNWYTINDEFYTENIVYPPIYSSTIMEITNEGIMFNDEQFYSTLVLKTNGTDEKVRGITIKILERDNWIPLVEKCYNDEITFTSVTYEGKNETWLCWDGV